MPRILLIDDNEDAREALAEILKGSGFDVVTAAEGERGLRLLRTERTDLVLMDMNMPVLDGWQAARTIRSDPQTRHVPVIGLTAHAMPGDRERALEAGCSDYHTKPIDLERLIQQIEAALRTSRAAPQA